MNDQKENEWSELGNPVSYNVRWQVMVLFRECLSIWMRGDHNYSPNWWERKSMSPIIIAEVGYLLKNWT